jgi:ethanolamine permease
VGYVISGMYFGWNLGLLEAGPYGFVVATLLVAVMYVCFVLNYAELTCALPKAGGAFVYVHRAFGPRLGFIAGLAQWVEFTFAPPAIATAIGAYFSLYRPGISPTLIAICAYFVFTALNIYGVKISAVFELVITVIAVLELGIFASVTLPAFSFAQFSSGGFLNGPIGILKALPFAIWFFLAIEAVANIAEESRNPERDLSRGFLLAMGTLLILALLVLLSATGVHGWQAIVFAPGSEQSSDSPLPLAMGGVVGNESWLFHLLISIGLFGLIASFHGIILASGRALFEMGRSGMLPSTFACLSPSRKTPRNALLFNMVVGIVAILSGTSGQIITLSVFGALLLYILSMAAQLKLRRTEPSLNRPFRAAFYPYSTYTALGLSSLCFVSLFIFNVQLALLFVALLTLGGVYYRKYCDGRTAPRPLRA